jgi:hypothetical protein
MIQIKTILVKTSCKECTQLEGFAKKFRKVIVEICQKGLLYPTGTQKKKISLDLGGGWME